MIGPGNPGFPFEAVAEGFDTGLVGTIGVTVDDNEGNNVVSRTTDGIIEIQTVGTLGVYRWVGVYPDEPGTYTITWDDGTLSGSEYLEVAAAEVLPPDTGDTGGPCTAWTDEDEVAACCGIEIGSDNIDALTNAAVVASSLLYELSGRLYKGVCGPVTARPCSTRNLCFPPGRTDYTRPCGCQPLSEVLLPGYPVQEVVSVLIDGELQPPSEYRLDDKRKLVRLADAYGWAQAWPACQRLDLPDSEERTWSVTYFHGEPPPLAGQQAASQLACQVYSACGGTGAGPCVLPADTTRVTRQGITVEMEAATSWLSMGQTGIAAVDMFIAVYGARGARRRPSVWSPEGPRYARVVGQPNGS